MQQSCTALFGAANQNNIGFVKVRELAFVSVNAFAYLSFFVSCIAADFSAVEGLKKIKSGSS